MRWKWERNAAAGIYRMAHFPPPEDGEMMAWQLLWSWGRDERPIRRDVTIEPPSACSRLGDFSPAKVHIRRAKNISSQQPDSQSGRAASHNPGPC